MEWATSSRSYESKSKNTHQSTKTKFGLTSRRLGWVMLDFELVCFTAWRRDMILFQTMGINFDEYSQEWGWLSVWSWSIAVFSVWERSFLRSFHLACNLRMLELENPVSVFSLARSSGLRPQSELNTDPILILVLFKKISFIISELDPEKLSWITATKVS